ncbi:polysaccharide deacetylase family protein [Pontibacter sp. BT310]|uniref:Polysaccharide deacetylase family protein n=1 Tax=Pontibacter populi TaxID=890055 RepID=A0ABS6XAS9_9BACT|nr:MULTISPECIES: polysaccharide deacetylase family protein [Pontibacter]MBJ6118259.1 polysaccharide deacetylase family protein [Pontibacter sp. BT310]MBR0570686.1 polysaccharide deacetylase family protein [Microvirga sp. STS03]MBW3365112.1 polysaccharide deacetylase family protein [Pontibacter populi]
MNTGRFSFLSRFRSPKALVLMYHRVGIPDTDIWEMTVTPENFEQQLQALKKTGNVIKLQELIDGLKAKKLMNNSIALTFDDGYADNYENAKQLLEMYQLPCTFFISSGLINKDEEFWWDELASIIFKSKVLPVTISITINHTFINMHLKDEVALDERQIAINASWKACTDPPPTLRCELYLKLWEALKPLPYTEQRKELSKIRAWANHTLPRAPKNKCMSAIQLQDLARNELFDIGAHTVTHPSLKCYNYKIQQSELRDNKEFLNRLTGRPINLLTYPYGNYNTETIKATEEAGFDAAFTTEEIPVRHHSQLYSLGRFQVLNLPRPGFERAIHYWQQLK